jgi:hypothetical protein
MALSSWLLAQLHSSYDGDTYIDGPGWMLGDNQSVITSSTITESTLNKRENALSYHLVRECIAANII